LNYKCKPKFTEIAAGYLLVPLVREGLCRQRRASAVFIRINSPRPLLQDERTFYVDSSPLLRYFIHPSSGETKELPFWDFKTSWSGTCRWIGGA